MLLPLPDALVVVHEDAAFIVVDKPCGLLSVPGRGEQGRDCLSTRVRAAFGDALVVHRLDMATSGLMIFARGAAAQRSLSMAFAARAVHKRYVAVADGRVAHDSGEIDLPLIADWPNRPKQKCDLDHGKPSLTRYRVLARDDAAQTTRLELEPVTGRAHQLRLHLTSLGHPILGDALYAPPDVQTRSARLLLHASVLRFEHPTRGVPMLFESPAPF